MRVAALCSPLRDLQAISLYQSSLVFVFMKNMSVSLARLAARFLFKLAVSASHCVFLLSIFHDAWNLFGPTQLTNLGGLWRELLVQPFI